MFIPGGNTFIGLLSVCVVVGAASNYVHEKGAARPLLLGRNGWRPIKREINHEHTLNLNEHEEDFTLAGLSEKSSPSQLAGQSKPKRSAHRRRKHPHHAGHNDFSLNLAASKDNIQEDYDYNIEEEVQDIPTGDDRFDSFHSHDNDNVHGSSVLEGDTSHDVTEESDPKPSNGFKSDKAGSFGASLVPHRSGPSVIQPPIIYFEEPKPGPEQNAGTPLSQGTNGTLVPVDPTISLPTSPSDDIKPEGPKTATDENTFDLAAHSTVQTPVAASTNRPDTEQKTVTSQPSSSANGQFTVPYFNPQATLGHTDLVSSIPDKLTTPGGLTEPVPAFTSVSADDVVNITPATFYTTRDKTGTTFVQSESSTTARSTDGDLHQKTENPFYSSTTRSFDDKDLSQQTEKVSDFPVTTEKFITTPALGRDLGQQTEKMSAIPVTTENFITTFAHEADGGQQTEKISIVPFTTEKFTATPAVERDFGQQTEKITVIPVTTENFITTLAHEADIGQQTEKIAIVPVTTEKFITTPALERDLGQQTEKISGIPVATENYMTTFAHEAADAGQQTEKISIVPITTPALEEDLGQQTEKISVIPVTTERLFTTIAHEADVGQQTEKISVVPVTTEKFITTVASEGDSVQRTERLPILPVTGITSVAQERDEVQQTEKISVLPVTTEKFFTTVGSEGDIVQRTEKIPIVPVSSTEYVTEQTERNLFPSTEENSFQTTISSISNDSPQVTQGDSQITISQSTTQGRPSYDPSGESQSTVTIIPTASLNVKGHPIFSPTEESQTTDRQTTYPFSVKGNPTYNPTEVPQTTFQPTTSPPNVKGQPQTDVNDVQQTTKYLETTSPAIKGHPTEVPQTTQYIIPTTFPPNVKGHRSFVPTEGPHSTDFPTTMLSNVKGNPSQVPSELPPTTQQPTTFPPSIKGQPPTIVTDEQQTTFPPEIKGYPPTTPAEVPQTTERIIPTTFPSNVKGHRAFVPSEGPLTTTPSSVKGHPTTALPTEVPQTTLPLTTFSPSIKGQSPTVVNDVQQTTQYPETIPPEVKGHPEITPTEVPQTTEYLIPTTFPPNVKGHRNFVPTEGPRTTIPSSVKGHDTTDIPTEVPQTPFPLTTFPPSVKGRPPTDVSDVQQTTQYPETAPPEIKGHPTEVPQTTENVIPTTFPPNVKGHRTFVPTEVPQTTEHIIPTTFPPNVKGHRTFVPTEGPQTTEHVIPTTFPPSVKGQHPFVPTEGPQTTEPSTPVPPSVKGHPTYITPEVPVTTQQPVVFPPSVKGHRHLPYPAFPPSIKGYRAYNHTVKSYFPSLSSDSSQNVPFLNIHPSSVKGHYSEEPVSYSQFSMNNFRRAGSNLKSARKPRFEENVRERDSADYVPFSIKGTIQPVPHPQIFTDFSKGGPGIMEPRIIPLIPEIPLVPNDITPFKPLNDGDDENNTQEDIMGQPVYDLKVGPNVKGRG